MSAAPVRPIPAVAPAPAVVAASARPATAYRPAPAVAPATDFAAASAGAAASPGSAAAWHRICPLNELDLAWGEAALVAGRQIALFRTGGSQVFAVGQADPATRAHVMARGIVGSRGVRPTIASPLHKEVYDLATGECLGSPGLVLPTYDTRLVGGFVEVSLGA